MAHSRCSRQRAVIIVPLFAAGVLVASAAAFVPNPCSERRLCRSTGRVMAPTTSVKNPILSMGRQSGDSFNADALSWRIAKVRLEEANTRRFLKSKPIKLSYTDSQKFIQRNWAPKTRQEFEQLVDDGHLKTSYISKRSEEYYGGRGEWISWDHYLLGYEHSGKNGMEEVLDWQ